MADRVLRHILQSQQFDRPFLEIIFRWAGNFKRNMSGTLSWGGSSEERLWDSKQLQGTHMIELFYEASTRTRTSFGMAGLRLGMNLIWTENAKEFSSAIKGETLEDTIRVLCEYCPDVIVLRHHETGAAERAATVSSVPIINAGDGTGQHPTQALLDLYTIWEKFGTADGLRVVMVGDLLNGRTVRSLAYLLAKYRSIRISFVSPSDLRIGRDITGWLDKKGIVFNEYDTLGWETLGYADVVYCTRIQKERGSDASEETLAKFRIGKQQMEMMKESAILMHPLPRNDEILPEVDSDPRAVYFKQAGNGMYVRMAILLWVLHRI